MARHQHIVCGHSRQRRARRVAPMEPIVPRYDRECVAAIIPTLWGDGDPTWLPEPVRDARCVVLLVLDGLGANAVTDFSDALPTIGGCEGREILTVLPATTSAALTSITTGCAPIEHGIVGYRILWDDAILNVLRWTIEGPERQRAPEPFAVQRAAAFRGRSIPVVTKNDFRKTGFTKAHLGDGRWCGWKTLGVFVERCRELANDQNVSFVYAYYPGVDEVAHEFGLRDGYYAASRHRRVDRTRRYPRAGGAPVRRCALSPPARARGCCEGTRRSVS